MRAALCITATPLNFCCGSNCDFAACLWQVRSSPDSGHHAMSQNGSTFVRALDVRPLLLSFSALAPRACGATAESRASDTGLKSPHSAPKTSVFLLCVGLLLDYRPFGSQTAAPFRTPFDQVLVERDAFKHGVRPVPTRHRRSGQSASQALLPRLFGCQDVGIIGTSNLARV
jgi:hypothetical protein